MEDSTFERDIDAGLSAPFKHISSKYFYDDIGSGIFQQIMKMPEYYPTASEFEILSLQSDKIIEQLNFKEPFNIVEFGAGDGIKTRQLLKKLMAQKIDFTYVPIDISARAIRELKNNMLATLPEMKIRPMVGNYFSMAEDLSHGETPALFLFLGGNIGNYQNEEANALFSQFGSNMRPGDKLLTGFDLRKNPATIRNAYDDKQGITKAFNLNLLTRINRELNANFELGQFDFYSHYDPANGEVKSYLVSLVAQRVYIGKTDKHYSFAQNELIWTELSKKFTLEEIGELAVANNFSIVAHFMDCKHYFTDSLWIK
ncbi:L-histidine N(alpha)-methyltransferase [Dyadobacter sp. CY312]|uniref:L-histidine N(alpha)-methyltransferase n=1 Tax=Dyadobacter sp. CY312 TaxID=2907303 RepID=UPI001F3C56E4|nr:L-histidine N(alpha)-methyltransferase [Dyadobacter sp. CY312]MCE7038761.1 L-histidine N(alpha)-methyltransferase [Dyadobacter sp. CY312]